jgi:MFS family permease
MWELYAFWAFVPFFISAYAKSYSLNLDISFWSFSVIAAGTIGCVAGGIISMRTRSAKVAFAQLSCSGICCLISPLLFHSSEWVFLAFLIFWGIVVVGDSPQFAALTALAAPKELVGTALTIVNCIGFTITIFSIQLLNYLTGIVSSDLIFTILSIGPLFGLVSLFSSLQSKNY